MSGSGWCYNHDPAKADERKRHASRGGQSGGRGRPGSGEVTRAKGEIRGVLSGLLKGKIHRGTASVMFAGFGVLARYIELERRLYELDEIEGRIEALEATQPDANARGGYRWGR
jgi:hypothetical protein